MNHWLIVCLLTTWAFWAAQTVALAFYALPRAAHFWAHQGYEAGRQDERNGVPRVAFVCLPPRKDPR